MDGSIQHRIQTELGIDKEKIKLAGPCTLLEVVDRTITIYDFNGVSEIYLDDRDNEIDIGLSAKVAKLLEEEGIIPALKWLINELETNLECPGFEGFDDVDIPLEADNISALLPDIPHKADRKLTITSWGTNQKGEGGHMPSDSQYDINASLISSSKKGLNLKQLDGRDKQIQQRVCRASAFEFLLRTAIKHIEDGDLSIISTHCSKGHHRSVAFAEILRDYYYPKAVVIHPNIRK